MNKDLVLSRWKSLNKLPLGSKIFSRIVGHLIPYTGSIYPHVVKIEAGSTEIRLYDTRRVRNHLNSIHAIALANLGEFTGGLAVLTAVPKGTRFIIRSLKVDYLKKARGTLTARAQVTPLTQVDTDQALHVLTEIQNEGGEIVCTTSAEWLLRKS